MLRADCRIVHIVYTIYSNKKQKSFPMYKSALAKIAQFLWSDNRVVSVCCRNLASHIFPFQMLNRRINIFSKDKDIKCFQNQITLKNEVSNGTFTLANLQNNANRQIFSQELSFIVPINQMFTQLPKNLERSRKYVLTC